MAAFSNVQTVTVCSLPLQAADMAAPLTLDFMAVLNVNVGSSTNGRFKITLLVGGVAMAVAQFVPIASQLNRNNEPVQVFGSFVINGASNQARIAGFVQQWFGPGVGAQNFASQAPTQAGAVVELKADISVASPGFTVTPLAAYLAVA